MNFNESQSASFSFNYTPPSFISELTSKEKERVYNAALYSESSNTIMCHKEVLDFFTKKRSTIIAWRKTRGFPEPISKSPLRWLRPAVMEWVHHEGGFKCSS
ncbi:helix-turn-helix transcriptional regulator [Candidatus Enterovibrio escicola]|uniref:helix-turn-helix transcriptional regulator n=1 Tax=Candidatus Enterovibrio escicola TaxID=1927127 RepID=UPI0012382613|nr:hypothetical protein [Candidatus Enterovibrio escacola]